MNTTIHSSTYYLVEGILLVILGLFGIALPQVLTVSVALMIGALLLVSGVIELVRSFQHRDKFFIFSILIGVLSIIVGALLLYHPIKAILTLTALLMIYFFWDGIVKVFLAYRLRGHAASGWILLSGILALILGFLILSGWPGTAVWVIGLLVGVNLFMQGVSLIVYSNYMKNSKVV